MQSYKSTQINMLEHAKMTSYDRGTRVITLLQLQIRQFGDSATILRQNLEMKNADKCGEITQET